jgi:hypothetical protein
LGWFFWQIPGGWHSLCFSSIPAIATTAVDQRSPLGEWFKGVDVADLNSGTLTTKTDSYNNAILPHASGLDTNQLTASGVTVSWADAGEMPTYTAGATTRTNIVTVTVNYRWTPAAYLGSMTMSSTSKLPISY